MTNGKRAVGVILGAMKDSSTGTTKLLSNGNAALKNVISQVESMLRVSEFPAKLGQIRHFYPDYDLTGTHCITVVGLGTSNADKESKNVEASRHAAAVGARALQSQLRDWGAEEAEIQVGSMPSMRGAAEGVHLGTFAYTALKKPIRILSKREFKPLFGPSSSRNEDVDALSLMKAWNKGTVYAQAQNLAREWMETPSNLMTPTLFCSTARSLMKQFGSSMQVIERDLAWAEKMGMNAFLAVAKGSKEEGRFLEVHYRPSDDVPSDTLPNQQSNKNNNIIEDGDREMVELALVGKGVTFDSGGISIKPSAGMAAMKADMGGAAVTLATMYAIAKLGLNVSVSAYIPLCENMPSGVATKPGDVVKALNGKTIEIDNTDAEGRLILADALTYAVKHSNPKRVIDIATLTGAMDVALGSAMAGFFSNSDTLATQLMNAGEEVQERVWRMPLADTYRKQIKSHVADLKNVGGRSAGSCTAACFLEEFLTDQGTDPSHENEGATEEKVVEWAHVDMAGVMESKSTDGWEVKGMSGRPTRALINCIEHLSQSRNVSK